MHKKREKFRTSSYGNNQFQRDFGGGAGINVNMQQCSQFMHMYRTKPALVSAKTVLHAQLLSGGLTLRKNGNVIELKPEFRRHVDRTWLPFAKSVIDSFMVHGFCAVSYVLDESFGVRIMLPTETAQESDDEEGTDKEVGRGRSNPQPVVPNVPPLSTYRLSFEDIGYQRVYSVNPLGSASAGGQDRNVRVFIRDAPDDAGNVNSAVGSTSSLGRFTDQLVDLAIQCEVGRTTPAIVTQPRRPGGPGGTSNPRDMFFDSESRDIHHDGVRRDDEESAMSLQWQMAFCRMANSRNSFDPQNTQNSGQTNAGSTGMSPPTLTLPREHELASYPLPQSRGDLGDLMRFSQDQMCSAMGVPSSLLFESHFSGKSTAQLSLLNSTIQQLSHLVNIVLTQAYHDIYGKDNGKEDIQFCTVVSPLASAEEVQGLYSAGLADFKVAAPLALHAIGASSSEVEDAMHRREKAEANGLADQVGCISEQMHSSAGAGTDTQRPSRGQDDDRYSERRSRSRSRSPPKKKRI